MCWCTWWVTEGSAGFEDSLFWSKKLPHCRWRISSSCCRLHVDDIGTSAPVLNGERSAREITHVCFHTDGATETITDGVSRRKIYVCLKKKKKKKVNESKIGIRKFRN